MTDEEIIREAKERFSACVEWEAIARLRFDRDYKFAHGDSYNMYQWEDKVSADRILAKKPCLTINKTKVHNNAIINDGKQNKPGVNVRPVGDTASFEAAQVYQEVVRHIEYISNAESVYDKAQEFQVQAGIGYWIIRTDYMNNKSFDQEIFIRPIKDPRLVYLDPDIKEDDGSDARYGFIFEDIPRDLFNEKYPKLKDSIGWSSTFDMAPDPWMTRNLIKVVEYYRKSQEEDTFVVFTDPVSGEQAEGLLSELTDEGKQLFKDIKKHEGNLPLAQRTYQERKVITDNIERYKIAGDKIIEASPWLGKYVPIVRCVGTETIIDGVLDRIGHTRSLINAQQIYNYNTSANVEFIGGQTKAPWLAAAAAIEGRENSWNNANTATPSVLIFNHLDEDGKDIPAPTRPQPPQPSQGYVQGMQIAQNEMMMATGQYQAQMGENENAKSGVAIERRQRQGDRATYHFIDNQAKAVRFTGKILIDLIPKIYDTERVIRISATDGTIMDVKIDPNAKQAFEKVEPKEGEVPAKDKRQEIMQVIFNPNIGLYDVISEVGPSYATKRQEAFVALTQIASQNKDFMGIAGDILWKVADFPEAQSLAERWRRIIPKNITGDAPDPVAEQAMQQAAKKIEELLAVITKQTQEVADKKAKEDIDSYRAETDRKVAAARAQKEAYDSETKRLLDLGNSENLGPEIRPIIAQTVRGMLVNGEPSGLGEFENTSAMDSASANGAASQGEEPPVEGARQAPDGMWYVQNPQGGGYMRVDPAGQANGQSTLPPTDQPALQ